MVLCNFDDNPLVQVELMFHKDIRVHCFDTKGVKCSARKVL